ncbi:Outer membrane protein A precursor [hydrothermal vent metagenome]|uniref:Outer membrane protein A n=1 Tax=hydrothermal vent metagenome TaxID=652676 RepID=A0A3B0ZE76_9ZZZZ
MFGKRVVSVLGVAITSTMLSAAMTPGAVASDDISGYWTTKSGEVWRNGFGQCWRTQFWKPEHAIAECEGESGKPADGDMDGVADAMDKCPNSEAGVKVDARGCELDSDKDGVVDSKDRCSATPAGTVVDANGCKMTEADSDGDGIVDSKDSCPGTSHGTTVNAKGCELDSDGDGVVDSKDRCPETAVGVKVGATGCSLDSDNDGIVDNRDECPGTSSGQKVDTKGCVLDDMIVLKGVNFATSSDTLKGSSSDALNEVAATLKRYPDMVVEVAGYTDNRGSASLNKALSQKRAESVVSYLIANGISSANLKAKGHGIKSPIADNSTAAGRAQNRRVELHIIQQ